MNDNGKPEVGQLIEIAIWLDGTETETHLKRWQEEIVPESVRRAEIQDHIVLGPVRYVTKRPGEERVPQVPKHINGPDVRLLVAEAPVLAIQKSVIEVGFCGDLEDADLANLRKVTRRAYRAQHPDFPALTDAQCDSIINAMGPQAAVATLRGNSPVQ